jgi:hypothetical protein
LKSRGLHLKVRKICGLPELSSARPFQEEAKSNRRVNERISHFTLYSYIWNIMYFTMISKQQAIIIKIIIKIFTTFLHDADIGRGF